MKEIIDKKMKESCVLLIASLMILSTVVVTADTNESTTFMLAGEDTQLQQTNIFDPDWIHFDDGTNVNSIGLTSGGTFEFAIRITPAELAGYDGYEITTVKWHHGTAGGNPQPSHSGAINIYDAGTSSSPGATLTSESFTTAATNDWETTTLSNPAIIDASKDIWISIMVTHAQGEHPAGVGRGPVVPGKGGWISTDGVTWEQLGIDIPSLNYNWNIWAKVEEYSAPPEKPERPEGPTDGIIEVEYTFSTSTTDPEGGNVSYLWDWGDENPTEWTDFYDSGATVYASHTWDVSGEYNITVKAKNPRGKESEWSDPKTICIADGAILEIENITGGLFKVSTVIKNTGGVDAINVNWSITLTGGIILLGKETSGGILSIPDGGESKISSSLIIGFGKTTITVCAEISESSDIKEQESFILLFFIKI